MARLSDSEGRKGAWRLGLLVGCFLGAGTAHAYIDPGSGYLLFQAIAALIAGIAATVGLYWRKFVGLIASFKCKILGAATPDSEGRGAGDAPSLEETKNEKGS